MPIEERRQAGDHFANPETMGQRDPQHAAQFARAARDVIGLVERGEKWLDPREIRRDQRRAFTAARL
jgi:hypothetical protein